MVVGEEDAIGLALQPTTRDAMKHPPTIIQMQKCMVRL